MIERRDGAIWRLLPLLVDIADAGTNSPCRHDNSHCGKYCEMCRALAALEAADV